MGYDYEITLKEPEVSIIRNLSQYLRASGKKTYGINLEWIVDESNTPKGLRVFNCDFGEGELEKKISEKVLQKSAFQINRLERNRQKIRKTHRKQVKSLESEIRTLESKLRNAESTATREAKTVNLYEHNRRQAELVLRLISEITGSKAYDANLLDNSDGYRDHLMDFFGRIKDVISVVDAVRTPFESYHSEQTLSKSIEEISEDESGVYEKDEYISESEAVDILFGLDKSSEEYKELHPQYTERFRYELAARTFSSIEFENFGRRGNEYERQKLEEFVEGEVEMIDSSGENKEVRRRFVVLVSDKSEGAKFFKLGAYTREDVEKKYNYSRQKLEANCRNSLLKKYEFEMRDGGSVEMYRKEDLDNI